MLRIRNTPAAILVLFLLMAIGCTMSRFSARNKAMEFKLKPIAQGSVPGRGDSSLTDLRLTNLDGPQIIAAHDNDGGLVLSLSKLIQDTSTNEFRSVLSTVHPLPELAGIPGPLPDWDATILADRSASAVWTLAGSAVSYLSFRNSKHAEIGTVNEQTPFGVFGAPHFLKADTVSNLPIAAIALLDGEAQVVVFKPNSAQSFAKHKTIETEWRGVPVDARLVRNRSGYLLFVKVLAAGAEPIHAERRTGSGKLLMPGYVDMIHLDAEFNKVAMGNAPFGDMLVFEFDAVSANPFLAIFATTVTGAQIAVFEEREDAHGLLVTLRRLSSECISAEPFASPSLIAANHTLYMAAIRSVSTKDAEIVFDKLDLDLIPSDGN
jgi:hypothetical protein